MNYLDVYYSRVNHLGETTAERVQNAGMRSFEKWLEQSPHTVRDLSVERGLYFDGILLENKDKEHKKIMFLHVANDIPLLIGDIMNWKLQNGTVEKWIILLEEKKVNPKYRTFWIIKCNYFLKWVDQSGHVNESWSYCTSSLDSMVKGNFRTWHNLISSQPNKFLEIIMPRLDSLFRGTNIIVEEESWTVVDYDHTSVPGVMYISLTEGKVNSFVDDVENNLADTDKIAVYELLTPQTSQTFNLGAHINPIFTLTKNGKICDEEIELETTNKKVVRLINDTLIAVGRGTTDLIAKLKNHPEITKTITITVGEEEPIFDAYIEGNEKLKLNRTNSYSLKGTKEISGEVNYSLIETQLAKIIAIDSNSCTVRANAENKLGTITLIASYNGVNYTKDIVIVPLW